MRRPRQAEQAVVQQALASKPGLTLYNPDGREPKALLDLKGTASVFGLAWR